MIIIGYQGIGKSTLANRNHNFIDLESSHFFVNGIRDKNWYIIYCSIAEALSKSGYNVFVSSHAVVREQLKTSSEKVIAIYPALNLKDEWIKKLSNRYLETNLEKDYKALANAVDRYEKNINEIANDVYKHIELSNINYSLGLEIARLQDH